MKKTLLTVIALLGVSGLAAAQPNGMGMGPGAGMGPGGGMAGCDPQTAPCGRGMEGRGKGGKRQQKMRQVDTDNDGRISLSEHNAVAEKRFARFDTDGDGTVTKSEFVERSGERFKKADLNGDGYITQDERQAMRRNYKGRRGPMAEE